MASIYQRPDSKNFCLSCYLRPGAKLLRASLGTENEAEAEKVARTVELLIELEKYSDTKVPEKLLECLSGVRSMIGSAAEAASVQPGTEAIPMSGYTERRYSIDCLRPTFSRPKQGRQACPLPEVGGQNVRGK